MAGEERSDPLSEMLNLFAAPLAGTIRSFDQFRRGVDEFLRGVENFNRTMENLNETAERVNVLLAEVEVPIKAVIPQITRAVKTADEMIQVVSGPAMAVAPGLNRLAEVLSTPGLAQLPTQIGQFTDVMADMSKRLGPLTHLAESAGGLFGGLRLPGMSPARPITPPPRVVVEPVPAGPATRKAAAKKRAAKTAPANATTAKKTVAKTAKKTAAKKTAARRT